MDKVQNIIEELTQENCECGIDESGQWSEIVFERFGCDCDESNMEKESV